MRKVIPYAEGQAVAVTQLPLVEKKKETKTQFETEQTEVEQDRQKPSK